METEHILNKNYRYKILPQSIKIFIENVFIKYRRIKDKNYNIILARCLLMFVCAARFYKGDNITLTIENLNKEKIKTLLRCCTKSFPEPGTLFVIQLCHLYNQPQQQNKMSVKRILNNSPNDRFTKSGSRSLINKWTCLSLAEQLNKFENIECYVNTPIYSKQEHVNKIEVFTNSNKNDLLLSSTSTCKICYCSFTVYENKNLNIWTSSDIALELYKKILKTCLTFCMCIELKEITSNALTFVTYHDKIINVENFIAVLSITFGTNNIVMWFTNEHRLFKLPEYLKDYLRNLEDYLYCRLTDRIKPNIPQTDNDAITKMMCRLVSRIIQHIGQRSLKSAGLADAGLNPFAMILNDAAIKNLEKFSNSDRTIQDITTYTINGPFESMLTNVPYVEKYNFHIKSTLNNN